MSGVKVDKDDFSHPLSFSNLCNFIGNSNQSILDGSFNNKNFLIELKNGGNR